MFVTVLVIVEHVQHRLRVLLLHFLADVAAHQESCPGLGQTCELSCVIIEPNVDNMCELGGIGDVGLLIVTISLPLLLALTVLGLLLRLLGQWPQVHGQADREASHVGGESERRGWWLVILVHADNES